MSINISSIHYCPVKSVSFQNIDQCKIDKNIGIKGDRIFAFSQNLDLEQSKLFENNPEERKGGRPRISDLRESGSIEQDADVVGLLMRPERYADDDDEKDDLEGEATFIVAKQRNGPIGDVPLTFIDSQIRFADRAREQEH